MIYFVMLYTPYAICDASHTTWNVLSIVYYISCASMYMCTAQQMTCGLYHAKSTPKLLIHSHLSRQSWIGVAGVLRP